MCLMISAETVTELMNGANAAMESGNAEEKKAVVEKIEVVLSSTTDEYLHYALLKNYKNALMS